MLLEIPGWELDVERGPDWLLVSLKNVPDRAELAPLADEIWELLQTHFTYRLVLEMDNVDVLNSHLIGQLVRLYKLISRHDGVMRVCGLSAYNRRVLRTCRLDDRLLPYQDRRHAIQGV